MSFKLKDIIAKRELVFFVLLALVFTTFIFSYALNSISLFLFIPYFFLDTKVNIKTKFALIIKNRLVRLFILFFIAQLVGVFYSEHFDFAIKRVLVMLPLLFLPAILSVEFLTKKKQDNLMSFLKYSIVLIFIGYFIIHVFVDKRAVNTFVYFTINEKMRVSQFYLIFILMLPIMEGLRQLHKKHQIFVNFLIIAITIGFVILLGNKTVLLFLFLFTIGIVYKLWQTNKKQSILLALSFLTLACFASQMPIIKNRVNVFLKTIDFNMETIITKNSFTQTKNTAEHRILIDYLAIKEIMAALPFGVGTGDFQEALNKQYNMVNFKVAIKNKFNNHNQYLAEFLKTGVLGGVLFLMLVFTLWKTKKSRMGFYFVLLFSIGSLVESYLDRQHGIVIFACIIPFFLNQNINSLSA